MSTEAGSPRSTGHVNNEKHIDYKIDDEKYPKQGVSILRVEHRHLKRCDEGSEDEKPQHRHVPLAAKWRLGIQIEVRVADVNLLGLRERILRVIH